MSQPWDSFCATLVSDHVVASRLINGPVTDPALESRMTALRRACLMEGTGSLSLLAHLAIQCFLNEYVWRVDDVEATRAEALWQDLAQGQRAPEALLLVGCYRSLSELPDAAALLRADWPPAVRAVLKEQVADPVQEQSIQATLPTLTPIRDGVSEAVRSQYERHPYPRWVALPRARPIPAEQYLHAQFPLARPTPLPHAPEVLVAGCGTGLHALNAAQRFPDGRILAIDLSRASLAYAARRTREAGVQAITYAQADLLELGRLDRTYDVIESVGVLHHLADPFEGARALAGLLRPGGVMKLGLYSATARAGLSAARALARSYGPGRLRELRGAILDAPEGDPLRFALGRGDFYAASSCMDLLLHAQECELGIADIERMLAESGLRLLGFTVPPAVAATYRAQFPQDPAMTDLANWRALEQSAPLTFLGMYQFWAQKA